MTTDTYINMLDIGTGPDGCHDVVAFGCSHTAVRTYSAFRPFQNRLMSVKPYGIAGNDPVGIWGLVSGHGWITYNPQAKGFLIDPGGANICNPDNPSTFDQQCAALLALVQACLAPSWWTSGPGPWVCLETALSFEEAWAATNGYDVSKLANLNAYILGALHDAVWGVAANQGRFAIHDSFALQGCTPSSPYCPAGTSQDGEHMKQPFYADTLQRAIEDKINSKIVRQ